MHVCCVCIDGSSSYFLPVFVTTMLNIVTSLHRTVFVGAACTRNVEELGAASSFPTDMCYLVCVCVCMYGWLCNEWRVIRRSMSVVVVLF